MKKISHLTMLISTMLISVALFVFCLSDFSASFRANSSVEAGQATFSGLDTGPWPCRGHDSRHTGQSQYVGAQGNICKWSYQTGGDINSSPAIGADGTIYVGSNDKKLYAINPDGSLKWSCQTGGCIRSSPAIGADGTIYVGSDDGKLYALNPTDGSLKWRYQTVWYISSSPAIGADGTIYVVSDDGKFYAIQPGGDPKWVQRISEIVRIEGYISSSPAIGADGTIYVGSYDGNLYALNSTDGSNKWAPRSIGGHIHSSPAIGANGTIYVGSDNGKLYALNPNDGSNKWPPYGTGGNIDSSAAIGVDGIIYVGSNDTKLYAIRPDGSPKWDPMPIIRGYVHSSPAIGADGTIYVGSCDDKLYALNPNGSIKWTCPTGGDIDSSPAIGADGTVYVGSDDHKLYAFKDVIPPSCTVTAPVEDALLCGGVALVLSGTATDNAGGSGVVRVELCFDDECTTGLTGTIGSSDFNGTIGSSDSSVSITWHEAQLAGNAPFFTWSYTWADPPDGQHTVKVRATDREGNVEQPPTVCNFQIDLAGPHAFHLLLPENEAWQIGQPTFTWEPTTDAAGAMGYYEIIIQSAEEGRVQGSIDDPAPINVGLTTRYQPEVPLAHGTYLWAVRAFDECGNATYASDAYASDAYATDAYTSDAYASAFNASDADTGDAYASDTDSGRTRTLHVDREGPVAFSLISQQPITDVDGLSWSSSHEITLTWATTSDQGVGMADPPYDIFINGDKITTTTGTTSTGATSGYTFQPPGDGSYEWYVVARDNLGNVTRSTNTFSFRADTKGPNAAITGPGEDSYWGAGGFRLTGICSDDPSDCPSGVATVEVAEVSGNGGQQWLPAHLSDYDQGDDYEQGDGHDHECEWWIDCPVSTNGPITFTVRAKDFAGNVTPLEEQPSLTVTGDVTKPQDFVLLLPEDGNWCPTATPTFQWEPANDTGSGVVRYSLIFDDCDNPNISADCHTHTPAVEIPLDNITSYTLNDQQALSQGVHTWAVRAFDAVGLSTTAAERTVKVDISNPGSPALINPPDNAWTNQSEFILNWSAAQDPYGEICGYWLALDQGKPNQKEPIFIAATTAGTITGTIDGTIAAPSDFSYRTGALAEGDHTWSVTTVDCAGNQGPPIAAWTIRIDRTPPATPIPQWPKNGEFVPDKRPRFRWSVPGDGPAGNPSGICRYRITIGDNTFETPETAETASDAEEYTPASDLPDGSVSWSVRAIDYAGNIGPDSEVNSFTVDSIPPEIIAQPAEGFYNAPFFITLSMHDIGDGQMGDSEAGTIHYTTDGTQPAASSPVYSAPIEVSSDKEIFLKVAAFDRAGNKSPVKTLCYILDTTAPVPDIDPLPDIWDECRVTVITAPTAMDTISGKITGSTADPVTYTRPGIYTITWTYDDGHGNTITQMQTIILVAPWTTPGISPGAPSETPAGVQQYGMIISGTAYDGPAPASGPGTLSDGTPYDGDWIGAFGPGGESDCRAVARIQADGHYDLIIGDYQEIADGNQAGAGITQVETGVTQAEASGNQSIADNETVTFKLLRCSDEQTLNSLESILFVPGETIQDKALHFGTCTQSVELVKGWNWVSFYVLPYDTSLGAVFGDHAGSARQIKTQTKSATNVPGFGWIGDDLNLLSMISRGAMFKIETTAGFTLNVAGTCIAPDMPIEVQKGWTWIAYLPGMCLPCLPEDAHDGEISVFGDLYQAPYQVYQVKSQTESRIKLPDGGFIGDLVRMCPGKGYIVKMNSGRTLVYPNP